MHEPDWSVLMVSSELLISTVKGGSVHLTFCESTAVKEVTVHGVDTKNYPNPSNREITGT